MNLLNLHRKRFKEAMSEWVIFPIAENEATVKKIARQLNMSQNEILAEYKKQCKKYGK